MLNLIRMNLLKVVRMKSLYIMVGIMVALCIVLVADTATQLTVMLDDSGATKQEQLQQEMEAEAAAEGEDVVVIGSAMDANTPPTVMDYVVEIYRSGIHMLLLAIFAVIYACGERDCGFLKNLCVCTGKRWNIVLAKMSSLFLFLVIQTLVSFGVMMITNAVFGNAMAFGSPGTALPVLAVQFLLHLAFSAFVLTVVELSRNSTISMIVSIMLSMGIGAALLSWGMDLLAKFTPIHLGIADYLIYSRIKMTSIPLDFSALPVTIGVGIVAFMGYLVISSAVFQKRDIY